MTTQNENDRDSENKCCNLSHSLNCSVCRRTKVSANQTSVHLAVVMPHSFFKEKDYKKTMYKAAAKLARMQFQVRGGQLGIGRKS